MDCKEIRSLLSRYLEDDLDTDRKNLVAQHLEGCEGCAKELDALRGMISSLGKLEKVEPPFDFLASVHQRLEQPSKARLILRRIFYPPHIKLPIEAVAVAATILLVIRIASFISPGGVMVARAPALERERIEVAMRPALEEKDERLRVAMKEERLPVVDYEAQREIYEAPREITAFKEPSVPISGAEAEVKAEAGIPRIAALPEELAEAKAMFVANAQLPTITEEVAVQLANQFVVEQGYTDVKASLPADSLYFDEFEQNRQAVGVSNGVILEARYNSIERVPVITYEDEMCWNVVYRVQTTPDFGQVVNVDKNTAKVRMIPKKVSLDYLLEK